jgi:hypothetical protein
VIGRIKTGVVVNVHLGLLCWHPISAQAVMKINITQCYTHGHIIKLTWKEDKGNSLIGCVWGRSGCVVNISRQLCNVTELKWTRPFLDDERFQPVLSEVLNDITISNLRKAIFWWKDDNTKRVFTAMTSVINHTMERFRKND